MSTSQPGEWLQAEKTSTRIQKARQEVPYVGIVLMEEGEEGQNEARQVSRIQVLKDVINHGEEFRTFHKESEELLNDFKQTGKSN